MDDETVELLAALLAELKAQRALLLALYASGDTGGYGDAETAERNVRDHLSREPHVVATDATSEDLRQRTDRQAAEIVRDFFERLVGAPPPL